MHGGGKVTFPDGNTYTCQFDNDKMQSLYTKRKENGGVLIGLAANDNISFNPWKYDYR